MRRHPSWKFRRVAGRLATLVLAALVCGIPAFCNEINKAIEKGDLEKVKALLKADPELISKKGGGILNSTPLDAAVTDRQKAIAKFLLTQGADIDAVDRGGYTVLGSALWNGNFPLADILRLFEGKAGKADLTPLMTAALSCDGSGVAAALQQGGEVDARDFAGNTALTFAAVNRDDHFSLQCPEVVSALVKAGADPWKARFYQVPDFEQHKPSKIAVLRVEDIRSDKDDQSKVEERFAEGIEQALSHSMPRVAKVIAPHYPILTLRETRDKLTAAGFQSSELEHPDRKRACAALGVDAVIEAVVKDYGHGFRLDADVLGTHGEASLEYWLTDCRTGDLLWRSDAGMVGEKRGFLAKALLNGFTLICEQTITFPRFDPKPERKHGKD
jgi:ankyrin repeat protein